MDPLKVGMVFILVAGAVAVAKIIADAALRYRELDRRDEVGGDVPQLDRRLERIEAAVDAVAVEVERLGELQRYTAQAVSGIRPMESRALPAPERSVTPH